jgi:tetratricopeptide (TPR) repeat protein
LNIKQNKDKQVLKEDPVMDWILNAKDYVIKNNKSVTGFVIAIMLAIGLYGGFNQMKKSKLIKAQDTFGKAVVAYNDKQYDAATGLLKEVTEKYASTSQAVFGAYLLGTINFEQGKNDEAIKWFEKAVTAKSSAQFVSGQALEGIATCYEFKGDVPTSIKYLSRALDDEKIAHRHGAIRWKMALLNQKSDLPTSKKLCNEIIADTTAIDYHQKAQNLLAVFNTELASN